MSEGSSSAFTPASREDGDDPPSQVAPSGSGVVTGTHSASRDRVLGRVRGPGHGPTLICVAGLHGNEPAGVLALERVLPVLAERQSGLSGEFVALLGNRSALAASRRFMDRDLNRAWTPERLDALREFGAGSADYIGQRAAHEDREQVELLHAIEEAVSLARGPVILIDFHTTSGFGGAFSTVSDRLSNRQLALHFPVPLILGLEEQLDGTLTDWFDGLGHTAIGFESGQHDEPQAVDRATSALWLAVVALGLLPPEMAPEADVARRDLEREYAHLPDVLEVRYRHEITEADGFVMGAGYDNFQPVRDDEILGEDIRGPVRAPEAGRILMPLYQAQGEDGFFIVRAFNPAWLWISERMRRARLDRLVHWLPGISRSRQRPDSLLVNRHVARWYALELLHLLGYRKHREGGSRLIVVKRTPRAGGSD